MIRLIGGEMPAFTEDRAPAGGALLGYLADQLPAGADVLVAGPHDDALVDALAARARVTCLRRSQPEAVELDARGRDVLCGTIAKLTDGRTYDVVVALDGLDRLCSVEGPQYDWAEALQAVTRLLRPGGLLLLAVENELGVHRLVDPASPTATQTDGAWRPLGEFDTKPGHPGRLTAALAAEGLAVDWLGAAWPLPAAPTLIATPDALADGPADALAAMAASAVARAYAGKSVLSDPRRLVAAAVRGGLGAELAAAWLVVAHRAPHPAPALTLPPVLLSDSPARPSNDPTPAPADPAQPSNDPALPSNDPALPSNDPALPSNDPARRGAGSALAEVGPALISDGPVLEIAPGPDAGWERRVVRPSLGRDLSALAGPLPAGRLLEELLLGAALRHDLPALRRLLRGWTAALPRVTADNVVVDRETFAVLDPSRPEHPDVLRRLGQTLLGGAYPHPWPAATDIDALTALLHGAAGLPTDGAEIPPDPELPNPEPADPEPPAPEPRREFEEQLRAMRRQLADAAARVQFYERELDKRDGQLRDANRKIAAFSGNLSYRVARLGLKAARTARNHLRKGTS